MRNSYIWSSGAWLGSVSDGTVAIRNYIFWDWFRILYVLKVSCLSSGTRLRLFNCLTITIRQLSIWYWLRILFVLKDSHKTIIHLDFWGMTWIVLGHNGCNKNTIHLKFGRRLFHFFNDAHMEIRQLDLWSLTQLFIFLSVPIRKLFIWV